MRDPGGERSGPAELLLVRHERTRYNEESRYQGRSDPGLSEAGRERAHGLRSILEPKVEPGDTVWSSSLRRSRETAAILFPGHDRRVDPRLDELDFGEMEGLTSHEARVELGGAFERWARSPETGAPPGGERMSTLEARVREWLRELRPGSLNVAVTHVVPIRVLTATILQIPLPRLRPLRLDPGDWMRFLAADVAP